MAKIKVTSKCEIYDGMSITFRAPCDSTAVDGLNVYYNGESQSFSFRDAHGNDLGGLGNLYKEGVYIHAILDTGNGVAYLQNADTNAYLEGHFDHFGQYDLFWWKRRINCYATEWEVYQQSQGGYTLENVNMSYLGYSDTKETFYYTAELSADKEGNLVLADPQTMDVDGYGVNGTAYDVFYDMCYNNNYFFQESSTGRIFKLINQDYQFAPVAGPMGPSVYMSSINAYLYGTRQVTTHHLGEWEYLTSADPEAYPHIGNSDNYEYIYLGVPFQNACNAPRISITSYKGTGTYGSSKQNTLTFDFVPDLVLMTSSNSIRGGVTGWFYGTTYGAADGDANAGVCNLTWEANTLSWYSTSALEQLNESGRTYTCMAIKIGGA